MAGMANLLLIDINPVGGSKPLVAFDVAHSVLQVPKPLGEVHLEKVTQEVLQISRKVGGKANLWEGEGEHMYVT